MAVRCTLACGSSSTAAEAALAAASSPVTSPRLTVRDGGGGEEGGRLTTISSTKPLFLTTHTIKHTHTHNHTHTGLDYLSSPTGAIAEAQALAAAAFGAARSFFLVNGCTAGIHAAIMASCPPGTTLLLARNCHLSAFNGAVLAGCDVEWVAPEADAARGVAHCVAPGALEVALEAARARGRRVGAAMVVSPTYFGAAARIAELAAVCRTAGVPLLVDEAHGAHFAPAAAQHPGRFPLGALQQGADAVIHSTHKVLTAMTQAAMLHVRNSGRVDADRVARALQVLQSSSPSYLLMASLDAARAHAFAAGAWARPLAVADAARAGLRRVPGIALLGDDGGGGGDGGSSGGGSSSGGNSSGSSGSSPAVSVAGFDPLRLVVDVAALGLTGYDAAAALERDGGIVPELATLQVCDERRTHTGLCFCWRRCFRFKHCYFASAPDRATRTRNSQKHHPNHIKRQLVVLVVGPGSEMGDAEALVAGVAALAEKAPQTRGGGSSGGSSSSSDQTQQQREASRQQPQEQQQQQAPPAAMAPRAAFFAATERVPLGDAALGRVCAELLCPYPPGVPLLVPGEPVTAAAVATLRATLASGGVVVGASDPGLETVLVVREGRD